MNGIAHTVCFSSWARRSAWLAICLVLAGVMSAGCERKVRVRVKVGVVDAGTSSSTVAKSE